MGSEFYRFLRGKCGIVREVHQKEVKGFQWITGHCWGGATPRERETMQPEILDTENRNHIHDDATLTQFGFLVSRKPGTHTRGSNFCKICMYLWLHRTVHDTWLGLHNAAVCINHSPQSDQIGRAWCTTRKRHHDCVVLMFIYEIQ